MGESFRELLQVAFNEYLKKNPRYSLRSFARSLGLAPSTIHQYLNGKYPPTSRNLHHIGQALGWSDETIEKMKIECKARTLSSAVEICYEDVPHFSVDLLLKAHRLLSADGEISLSKLVEGLNPSPGQIDEVNQILEYLERHQIITKSESKICLVQPFKLIARKTPSGSFLEYQKQTLRRYETALTQVEKQKRLSLIANISVSEEDLDKVGIELNRFVKSLKMKYGKRSTSINYQMICGVIPFDPRSAEQSEH